MNHHEFMLNKKNKKPLNMMDFVKNTGKPKTYKGGRGSRGGAGGNTKPPNKPPLSQPPVAINLYFGGRSIMSEVSQPHIMNPEHLPVNIGNMERNPEAVQAVNRDRQVDLQEVLENQRQHQNMLQHMRHDVTEQLANPDRQKEILQNMRQSQEENRILFERIHEHNQQSEANSILRMQASREHGKHYLQRLNEVNENISGTLNRNLGHMNNTMQDVVGGYNQQAQAIETLQTTALVNLVRDLPVGTGNRNYLPPQNVPNLLREINQKGHLTDANREMLDNAANYYENPNTTRGQQNFPHLGQQHEPVVAGGGDDVVAAGGGMRVGALTAVPPPPHQDDDTPLSPTLVRMLRTNQHPDGTPLSPNMRLALGNGWGGGGGEVENDGAAGTNVMIE